MRRIQFNRPAVIGAGSRHFGATETATTPVLSEPDVPAARAHVPEIGASHLALALRRADLDARLPSASTLMSEVVGDATANCLERAATRARPLRDNLVFLDDRADTDQNGAGHVVLEDRATGRVWDSSDGSPPTNPRVWPYRSVEDWIALHGGAHAVDARVLAERVRHLLALPPALRRAHVDALGDEGLSRILDRRYADGAGDRAAEIDRWAESVNAVTLTAGDGFAALVGQSQLGVLSEAEQQRVLDHASELWSSSPDGTRVSYGARIVALASVAGSEPDLGTMVASDYTDRALRMAEDPALAADARAFATGAIMADSDPARVRARIDGLGDRAEMLVAALRMQDDRTGSVPAVGERVLAGSVLLQAAAQGAPTEASTGVVTASFAALDERSFDLVPGLDATVADALARHWHPNDEEARQQEAARFREILATPQGRRLMFDRDQGFAARAESLALLRAHPDWDAATIASHADPWASPTIAQARAQPRAQHVLETRGDDPILLSGSELDNAIAEALASTPDDPHVTEVAAAIRAVGGDAPEVTTLPIQFSSSESGPVDLPLFRVGDQYVDNLGNQYASFAAWQEENVLPSGSVTYPQGGHLTAEGAGVALETRPTPRTVDSTWERIEEIGNWAALAGGVVAGGLIVLGTGGLAAPTVFAAASAWGVWRDGGEELLHRYEHGRSLDPISDDGARAAWLGAAANALGFGGGGAATLARMGASSLSGSARILGASASIADIAGAGNAAVELVTDWDDLTGEQRASLAASIGLWGGTGAAAFRLSRGPTQLAAAAAAGSPSAPFLERWGGPLADLTEAQFVAAFGRGPYAFSLARLQQLDGFADYARRDPAGAGALYRAELNQIDVARIAMDRRVPSGGVDFDAVRAALPRERIVPVPGSDLSWRVVESEGLPNVPALRIALPDALDHNGAFRAYADQPLDRLPTENIRLPDGTTPDLDRIAVFSAHGSPTGFGGLDTAAAAEVSAREIARARSSGRSIDYLLLQSCSQADSRWIFWGRSNAQRFQEALDERLREMGQPAIQVLAAERPGYTYSGSTEMPFVTVDQQQGGIGPERLAFAGNRATELSVMILVAAHDLAFDDDLVLEVEP